jgi:hypothetical protein
VKKNEVLISAGTPESRAIVERVRQAIAQCERLNQLPFDAPIRA